MAQLYETQQALFEIAGNVQRKTGQHHTGNVKVDPQGMYVGSEDYDPIKHSPSDIDLLSPFAIVWDKEQVTLTMPERPLEVSLVIDSLTDTAHPAIQKAKQGLAYAISEAVNEALPGQNDRVFTYVAAREDRADEVPVTYEMAEAGNPEELAEFAAELSVRGLTFVLSDFEEIDMAGKLASSDTLIAVKLNHPLEVALPLGVGRVSLGGWSEVNTNNKRQLKNFNKSLGKHHGRIVARLENSGAAVAQVEADPHSITGYQIDDADTAIAGAVRSLL